MMKGIFSLFFPLVEITEGEEVKNLDWILT